MAAIRRLPVAFSAACLRRAPRRSLSSVAAISEPYYESEWDDDHRRAGAMAEACGARVGRGVQWVFMGSPAVRKHAYASGISQLLGVPYISMGSLVRQELSPRSSLYKQIASAVNEGKLVPEDIIFALLSKRLEEGHYKGETGFILDGIPRTRFQAEILDQMADIDLVVNFKCTEKCLTKTQFGRAICSYCGKFYHSSSSESTSTNPCVPTRSHHAHLNCSVQDREEIHREKFQFYEEQNQLLEDYYRKQMKLLNFQVADGPGETWQGLLAALHLQQPGAISCWKSLTS